MPSDVLATFKFNGCYITDGRLVTVCGQDDELYAMPWELFSAKYTTTHECSGMGNNIRGYHDHFREPPVNWTAVTDDTKIYSSLMQNFKMMGLYLPSTVTGLFTRPSGEQIIVNDPKLGKLNMGSVVICPTIGTTLDLDYPHMDVVPSQVFAHLFHRTRKPWNMINNISKQTPCKLGITEVRAKYKFVPDMHTYSCIAEVNWVSNNPKDVRKSLIRTQCRQFILKFAVRLNRCDEPKLLYALANFKKITAGAVSHSDAIKRIQNYLKCPVTTLHTEDMLYLPHIYVSFSNHVWVCDGSNVHPRFMEYDQNSFTNYAGVFDRLPDGEWKLLSLNGNARVVNI